MSVRIERASRICGQILDEIYQRVDAGEDVSFDEVPAMVRAVCRKIADQDGVRYNTVMDQITRQLELSTSEMYTAMQDFIVAGRRDVTALVDALCNHSCDGDNNANIKQHMRSL